MTIFKHSFITVCAMLAAVALVLSSCNNENEDDQLRVTLPDAPVTAYFDYGQTHSFTVKMEKERSYEIEQVPNGWTAQLESKTKLVVTAPKSGGEMSGVVKISVHRKERTVSAQLKVEILPATTLTANANSYIISKPNTRYKIKATVKGNSSQKIDGTPASAALVWQTSKGLLGTVMLDGDHISFVTTADADDNTKINKGNAVIAVKDADDNTLWSWHLWLTDYDPAIDNVTYPDGSVMMDRNLGAMGIGSDDIYEAYGLFYQWGRKDPLIMSQNATSTSNASTYNSVNSNVSFVTMECDEETGTIEYTTKYPTQIIRGNEKSGYDWLYKNHDASLWGNSKTMYDPCPTGWKVPAKSVWNGFANLTEGEFNCGWYFRVSDGSTLYPAAGRRSFSKGTLTNVNHDGTLWTGYYWSADATTDGKASSLYFNLDNVEPSQSNYRAGGFQVRCVKE